MGNRESGRTQERSRRRIHITDADEERPKDTMGEDFERARLEQAL